MLRAADEKGGIGVYSRNLVKELLAIDSENEYVLFYASDQNLGKHAHHPNVTECVIKGSGKLWWDQVSMPLACRKYKIDLLFNPKFTISLLAPCKTAMVFHGADWFIPEHAQYYDKWDVRYIKLMMPWYCKKCTFILSVSEITTDNFNRFLDLPEGKVITTYFGPAKHFRRIEDTDALKKVKDKYKLPDQFIFSLSGYDRGTRKNIDKLLEAYHLFHGKAPHKLVLGGRDCYKFKKDYNVPDDGWGADILFPDWIDQEDLPAIYSQATVYLYPSNVEAFPIPLTESLACGTPIITSDQNGLREIAGDAARFVNADDPASIAAAIEEVVTSPEIQQKLSAAGLERSKTFGWDQCARKTLDIINRHG